MKSCPESSVQGAFFVHMKRSDMLPFNVGFSEFFRVQLETHLRGGIWNEIYIGV